MRGLFFALCIAFRCCFGHFPALNYLLSVSKFHKRVDRALRSNYISMSEYSYIDTLDSCWPSHVWPVENHSIQVFIK